MIECTLDTRINRIAPINHVKSDKKDKLWPLLTSACGLTKITAAERPWFVLALRSGSLGGRE